MNSTTTSLVARQYRLQQWADQIRECQNRSSGLSVKEWCSQHELTAANYYYRLKEVCKACLDHVSHDAMSQSVVPVPAVLMHQHSQPASASGLEVSVNNVSIHVTNETSPDRIIIYIITLIF